MADDSDETGRLLRSAADGDDAAWAAVLTRYRERLRRIIAFRLDGRLRGRIDASDVVQEVCLEAWGHLADYLRAPAMPFFLWLRGVTANKLLDLHRHHLGAQMRNAAREVALGAPGDTSAALAAGLVGEGARPSEAAARAEARERLEQALGSMDPLDREALALRHFEHLSNAEAARVLGVSEAAAGKRYLRALKRLKDVLAAMPGGLAEL